ncbi:MAG: TRC40/GET3/ArsA family transport-energizing ATPase [Anaerolineales bacterium]|nr:TRC40/GET3/ArsA family transport-energizing ATPase [Anaerolineales bacterium]
MTTDYIFFSGKGGVGKTSMACTHAVRMAGEGKKTLIVTTDPASNLADVFEQPIGHQITLIQGMPNLWAMEIDPDTAAQEYREHALAPIRELFPAQMVQVIEEQMSGPCTTEVASFDRFTDFLEAPQSNGKGYDVVIFDTAPTGHTLRLLELPFEWSQSIDMASQGSGQTCIGPTAAIQDAKQKYERAMSTLRDAGQSTFIFVLHPEAIAIKETRRSIQELSKLGIHNYRLIINGIIPENATPNALFAARAKMQKGYMEQIELELPLPAQFMWLLSGEIKGIQKLQDVAALFFDGKPMQNPMESQKGALLTKTAAISPLALNRILPNGKGRTLFFAGKGGVGKTVASCITAVWLARQGYRTLLLTTDPAAHIGDVIEVLVGDQVTQIPGIQNLWAAQIDPKAAAAEYRARILADARQRGRTEDAVRVMEEELDSPCTEEMAAFDRFIDFASQPDWDVIVFDTAPTGHTLRLLELPVDWSQQIEIKAFASVETSAINDQTKQRFGKVIEMMQDPARSTFAFVMYPEATPILEAERAIQELKTVGIQLGLVIANQVIPADQADTAFTQSRRVMQETYLDEIQKRFPVPVVQIPLMPYEIKSLKTLAVLGETIYPLNQKEGLTLNNGA